MKKRVLVLMLVSLLVLQSVSIVAKTDGEKLKDFGLLKGDSNGELKEDYYLTRAELATLLCRLNKVDQEAQSFTQNMGFTDVTSDSWYFGYVNYCKSKGWMNGVGDNTFDAGGFVNEEMVATVMLRVLGYEPVWGDGVALSYGVGMYVNIANSDKMARGDTFSYMYETLLAKVNNSEETLAESFGIEIDYVGEWYGLFFDDSHDLRYININGVEVDSDFNVLSQSEDGFEDYMESLLADLNAPDKKKSFSDTMRARLIHKNDEWTVVSGSTTYGPYDRDVYRVKSYQYAPEFKTYVSDTHYMLYIPETEQIFKEGLLPKVDGYILGMTENGIIYRIHENGDLESSKIAIYGFDGSLIYEDKSYIRDTFIIHQYYGHGLYTLSDFDSGTVVIDGNAKKVLASSDEFYFGESGGSIYLSSNETDVFKVIKVNIQSKAISDITYEENGFEKVTGFVNSSYKDMYVFTVVNYYEDLSDQASLSVAYDLYGSEMIEFDYHITKAINEEYGLFEYKKNGKYGVVNFKNELITEAIFEQYTLTSGYYGFSVLDGNETIDYNISGDLVSDEDRETGNIGYDYTRLERKVLFPNGNYILQYSGNEGNEFVDKDGGYVNGIKDVAMGIITSVQLVGTYIDGEQTLYDYDGNLETRFKEYDYIYTALGRYVGAIKDEKTYILDVDGSVLYGPFDGKVYFIIRDNGSKD